MEGDEQQALQAGCHGYIAKPIEAKDLIAQIRGYLRSAQSNLRLRRPPACLPESLSAPQSCCSPSQRWRICRNSLSAMDRLPRAANC